MDDLIRPEKESPRQDPDITPPPQDVHSWHMLCLFGRVRICYDVPEGMNGPSVFRGIFVCLLSIISCAVVEDKAPVEGSHSK